MRKRIFCILLGVVCCCTLKADLRKSATTLQQLLSAINYLYVDSADIDKLTESGIKAMLKELDPHSTYVDEAEIKAMEENLGGSFSGIGVRYTIETDTIFVINTVIGGPSEKAGILAGDRIISVNDTIIAGTKLTTTEVQKRLRGPKGSHVKLGIMRDGDKNLIQFNLIRDDIPVYSIDASYMAAPTVGYIQVSRFAQTTPEEIGIALDKLTAQGMQDLIIDLQNNGGGYLQSAVEMANFFIPSGSLIVYTQGRKEPARKYFTSNGKKFPGKIVVLVDEESASASEIFAGAIQDLDRGVIVGRRTFGKGLVQRPLELPNGGMVKLTVAHYYTPSGRCIQKPYQNGKSDNYKRDLVERYNRGELLSADSIHFADSLKYTTANGRIVYGGGGILADCFVPLDTTKISPNHRTLIARGIVSKFVMEYFRENQKKLQKDFETFEKFNEDFVVTDKMIDKLYAKAEEDSIKLAPDDDLHNNELLKMQCKANIAADLYETGAFAQIMNKTNKIFCAGLDIITNEEKYNKYLKK